MSATSNATIELLAAIKLKVIGTNANFYKVFYSNHSADKCRELIREKPIATQIDDMIDTIERELSESDIQFISIFDQYFPKINKNVKNNSEKPFIFAYKGNIDLLAELDKNVAVIGLINPTEAIIIREQGFVAQLAQSGINIVSGLAKGCDTIAHKTCIDNGGKTIAILPSSIHNIFPADNKELADKIVDRGGLLISEYFSNPPNKYEAVKRFIDRDRLQAMFAKAVILTASYRHGDTGDSGSRHAIEAAKKYKINIYALFNKGEDEIDPQFALNKDCIAEGAIVLTDANIRKIVEQSFIKEPQQKSLV
jgi:DNA processing protein